MAIKVPKGVTRPTTDFVRQAVFSILGGRVEGAQVLDLFAGSGALGLEALSRGAASCVFVEENRAAEGVIRENLMKTRLEGGRVVKAEVLSWLGRDGGSYDLIFADPPYAKSALDRDWVAAMLERGDVAQRLRSGGLWVVEQAAETPVRESDEVEVVDRREYGSSAILLYRRRSDS